MQIAEVNNILRNRISELITNGWLKTHIGKVLLGANGQAHLNHFLKPNEDGSYNDFGTKPLQKIANVVEYDVMLVFVPRNNTAVSEYIGQLNLQFIGFLCQSLLNFLDKNIQPSSCITKTSRTQIDNVLDDLLPTN